MDNEVKSGKEPFYKKWWFWVIVVLFVGIIAVSGNEGDSGDSTGGGTNIEAGTNSGSGSNLFGKKVEVVSSRLDYEYNSYLGYTVDVVGTAKNNSSKNYSYVQIEFVVYDANGNNLGTALANINNLMAGDTWNFEASLLGFPSTAPASYKLVDITAY